MKEVKKDKIKGSNGYDYTIATRKARVGRSLAAVWPVTGYF